MKPKANPPVALNGRVWWLGSAQNDDYLQENSWLVLADGRGILVDPGPVSRFDEIFRAFSAVSGLESLAAIAITQPEPDAYASVPLWERAGFSGKIIAHWKTALLLPSLGIRSPFRYVHHDETDESGQLLGLRFIPLPHVWSPGSLGLYDPRSGTLFSGNLFGAFGKNAPLLGEPASIERVVQFHETHVPFGEPFARTLDAIEPLGATLLCPQHGSARAEDVAELFAALRKGKYGERAGDGEDRDSPDKAELELLRKEHLRLQEHMVLGKDDSIVDRLTGLYTRAYLDEFLPSFVEGNPEGAIASFRPDGMKALESESGKDAADGALGLFARIVIESRNENTLAFRDSGASLILLFQDEESAIPEILNLQKEIANSRAFAQRVTSSGAVVFCAESSDPSVLTETLRERTRALEGMGPSSLCVSTEGSASLREGSLLLVEPDRALARLFSDFFAALRFEVRVAYNGEEALAAITRNPPALVVCEERFPRSDVFAVHEAFARSTAAGGRAFVLLAERKSERLVRRSFESGIRYLLEKPVMLAELEQLAKALWEDALAER